MDSTWDLAAILCISVAIGFAVLVVVSYAVTFRRPATWEDVDRQSLFMLLAVICAGAGVVLYGLGP